MKYGILMNTPIGIIGIEETDGNITRVNLNGTIDQSCINKKTDILMKAEIQLNEYFALSRKEFDLPLLAAGTEFEMKCWSALNKIPYGETISYKMQAEWIGNPKACRAVGRANNRNPLAIFVPCHRVIGSSGSLIGFASGVNIKAFLLDLEKKNSL